jgi:adenine-specific DNA-methyltransferase
LADYGVAVQVGYYVWNRERERLREAPEQNAAPLYWACNIRPGQLCFPRARKRDGVDYVSFKKPSAAVILGPAVLLQRVTNSKQPRRLVAGMAPDLPGGFTTENHVILLRPIRPDVDLNLVCRLLNTKAADDRYRRLSGTASLSAKLLRRLDLPDPARFRAALVRNPDVEQAAAEAYGREPKQHRSAA